MTLLRGITLLDLISELPSAAVGFLPADVAGWLELLSVCLLYTSPSPRD